MTSRALPAAKEGKEKRVLVLRAPPKRRRAYYDPQGVGVGGGPLAANDLVWGQPGGAMPRKGARIQVQGRESEQKELLLLEKSAAGGTTTQTTATGIIARAVTMNGTRKDWVDR